MKKLKSLLIAVSCVSTTFSYGQWVTQTSGTTETLNSVYFTDEDTGYAGGSGITNATLLKTTDGGTTWNNLSVNSVNEIYSISFGTNNTGYVLTKSSELFKTTDAGVNWVNIKNFGVFDGKIEFFNADTGFVANGNGEIFRTLDGGTTWDSTQLSGFNNPDAIHFPSIQVGYAANYWGSIAKTTDMGLTWNIIGQPTSKPIWDIHFVSETVGYAVGGDGLSSLILKTTDGGSTWNVQTTTPSTASNHNAVFFTDANTGYCGNSTIYKTSDGGSNWNSMTNSGQILDLFFPSANIGYAVGYNGTILKLDNTTTGINNKTPNTLVVKVSPNPTTGDLSIDLGEQKNKITAILANNLGQIILTKNFETTSVVNLNINAPIGIYFLKLETADGETVTIKVIKK